MAQIRKREVDLRELEETVFEYGPGVLIKEGIHLRLEEAEKLATMLKRRGMIVQPYDFPYTFGVWQVDGLETTNEEGVPYTITAIKEFVQSVAAEKNVSYKFVEGFRICQK